MSDRPEITNPQAALRRNEFRHAGLILAGLVLLVYGPSLFGGSLVGGADVVRSAYPIRRHFWSMVQRGELPTWSSYLMGGYPILVEEQASLFYPPEWLFGVFRTPAAYNLIIGLHAWAAGLGAFILARKLRLSRLAAWMVVAVAILGAPLTARVAAGHPSHFYGRTLTIWIMAAILFHADKPSWWSALRLALGFGAQLLIGIGNYQTALYAGLVSFLFALFVLRTRVAKQQRGLFVAWGIIALALAFGLGAARAAPTLEVGLQSSRQGGLSTESLNYGALPPLMLAGYFLPHAFDDPSISDYTWPEFALYVGSAPFVLALYGSLKRRADPTVRFWIVITLIFLFLSLGSQGGIFPLFTRYFPGYQFFRNPARHGMVTSFGVMLLAGYGFDQLGLRPRTSSAQAPRLRWVLGLVVSVLALAIIATYRESAGPSFELLPVRALRGALWFFSASIGFYLAYRLASHRASLWLGILPVATIALDLLLYATPQIYQNSAPAELPYIRPENFPGGLEYATAFLESGNPSDWGLVNVAADNGVRLLNMYTGVIPLRMSRVVNLLAGRPATSPQEENLLILDQIARPDLLDLLGVKYLLVAQDHQPGDDPSLEEGLPFDHLHSFKNRDAKPFAFIVPGITSVSSADAALEFVSDSQNLGSEVVAVEGEVTDRESACPVPRIVTDRFSKLRLEGGHIGFEFEASQSGILIVNQTYQNGWQGWVDGRRTPVYAVDYRWIGIHLPCPGTYSVELSFFPASLTFGLLVSAISMLVVVVISLVKLRRSP